MEQSGRSALKLARRTADQGMRAVPDETAQVVRLVAVPGRSRLTEPTAERRMWAHYVAERSNGRTPTGAELPDRGDQQLRPPRAAPVEDPRHNRGRSGARSQRLADGGSCAVIRLPYIVSRGGFMIAVGDEWQCRAGTAVRLGRPSPQVRRGVRRSPARAHRDVSGSPQAQCPALRVHDRRGGR